MIVYVESNFLCELGLSREEREQCDTLLEWCEAGRIQLRLPAFAIPEVRRALRQRETKRLEAIRLLNAQRDDARRHTGDGDLLVLSCILRDLVDRRTAGDTSPSVFVTGDADFRSIKSWLLPFSCDLLTTYSAAIARLKGSLA